MAPKFVPRQRKHKVLARQKAQQNAKHEIEDTNQDVVVPASKQEREARKASLREELQQEAGKMSGKKAKRFEKYLDNKLKKDENRELLAKLAKNKVDTSLFSSSRALGQGKETRKQQLRRALREEQAGLEDGADRKSVLFQERRQATNEDEDEDQGDSEDGSSNDGEGDMTPAPLKKPEAAAEQKLEAAAANVGSGLKRPLDVDDEGRPVIPKRQKRGGVKSKVAKVLAPTASESCDAGEDEWQGFSNEEDDDADSGESEANSDDEQDEDSESDSGEQSSADEDEDSERPARKPSAFKAWATAQRNKALGFEPTQATTSNLVIPKPENFVPRAPEEEPLPAELQVTKNVSRKAFSVSVERSPEVQAARMKLPILAEEQRLMEAIHNNNVVVVCGATGSGKTTQLPQFLYESGYGSPDSPTPGLIGITQPRRVAAVSMAKRVGDELGDQSDKVAYQIRFEGTVKPQTAIKFMTDGVLLREAGEDIALRKYSAIVIDEAHERSVNTDILIGMLSRVVKLRAEMAEEDPKVKPLKLIIMSATLRVEDLTANATLFPTPPPVVEVEGRQHPVTMHFARRTQHDYVEEAFRKICRGHKKLPPGNFLVFLTGRNEILQLSKRLKEAFGGLRSADGPKVHIPASDAPMEVEDVDFGDEDRTGEFLDDYVGEDELSEDEDGGEEEDEFKIEDDEEMPPLKAHILPLFSLLPTREQLRVFEPPPEGSRQIVLATNVAETSLTIPGIRFVFDCGRSKERCYDKLTGVQSFDIGWISKASADQRAGRAGRTGPGHCYRLYSSAVFERDFPQFSDPEILRMPLEGVVLQLKSMKIAQVTNFPFPTPPGAESLARAEQLLKYLSSISSSGKITSLGSTMSLFPLAPRFARILMVGHSQNCLPYTIAMVAGLSAREIFVPEDQAVPKLAAKEDHEIRTTADVQAETRQANARRLYNEAHRNFCNLDGKSDAIKLLRVVGEFAHEPTEAWCESHFVSYKVLKEIQQLRKQLTELIRINIPGFQGLRYQDQIDAPSGEQVNLLKQIAAAGFFDQVAIRADQSPSPPEQFRAPRRAIDVPYIPLVPLEPEQGASSSDQFVYIHPSSPASHLSVQECPKYIVYSYLQRPAAATVTGTKKPKTRMHALTDITGAYLANLAKGTPLLQFGKPVKELRTWREGGESFRECWFVPYLRAEGTGGQGWPLPQKRVVQKRVTGKGWVAV
ncbi:hypothetical protein NLU13_9465 [Sarocladium strictum]|uniref:RNA helicase n=1 Tax=Sarocladium strictum TaxID=5046 RepID=A0AA39L4G0_SARSR|nr:hypothetical protein NLU13_9465 [Sarocladium strictum]